MEVKRIDEIYTEIEESDKQSVLYPVNKNLIKDTNYNKHLLNDKNQNYVEKISKCLPKTVDCIRGKIGGLSLEPAEPIYILNFLAMFEAAVAVEGLQKKQQYRYSAGM